jgi:hypothetical protein
VTVTVVEETVYVPGVGHVVINGVGRGVFECEVAGEMLESGSLNVQTTYQFRTRSQ